MCDVTFGRVKVWCGRRHRGKGFDMLVYFVRYPILMRYACSWMQRFSTSCKFNKHRNRRNYEYVYGRRIIFGLCKCFSHMQFMGRTKKILQSWKGICCIFLHLGFENGDIRLTSQVFDIPISGSPQRTNYPLDRAGCARGRYCTVANKKSCLHLWSMWASPTWHRQG